PPALTLQVSGRGADRLGRRPLVLAGLGLSAIGMGTMGLAGNLYVIIALTCVLGVGAAMLNPAQQASVADVVGNDRSGGKVLAGFQMCQDAGAIGGAVLVGWVADVAGWEQAFAVCGAGSELAPLPWLLARHHAGTAH